MRRYYPFFVLLAMCMVLAPLLPAQNLTKEIVEKHDNGKPKLVRYYSGAKVPLNMVRTEVLAVDGQKLREEQYARGELHGTVKEWKEFDGTLTMELHYVEGQADGEQKYYFSDGKPKAVLNFRMGKMDGRQVEFWFKPSGDSLQSEHNYANGVLHGMQRRWDKDGQAVYNLNFMAGKPDGIQRMSTEAGQQAQETWKQGTLENAVENWTAAQPKVVQIFDYIPQGDSLHPELGRALQKTTWFYESGALNAITIASDPPETQVFHLNGKLKGKGQGSLDQPEGHWEFYHDNGSLATSGTYKNGKKTGIFQSWDEQQHLISEEVWNADGSRRESWKVHLYHPNGKEAMEGNLNANGEKTGLWKVYFPSGAKQREEEWSMVCAGGKGRSYAMKIVEWDEDGKVMVRGSEAEQMHYSYFPNGNPMTVQLRSYTNRDACDMQGKQVYKDGKIDVQVTNPVVFDAHQVLEEITFQESGDTMRIDRFDTEGKRHGVQEGWYTDGKRHYHFTYKDGHVVGAVKEWYPDGTVRMDLKIQSAVGGPPNVLSGTYYNDKGKAFEYDSQTGKDKKKAVLEIEETSHFSNFWPRNQ